MNWAPRHLGGTRLAFFLRPLGIDFALWANGCLRLAVWSRRRWRGCYGRFRRRGLLVNHLPNLVQFFLDAVPGLLKPHLRAIEPRLAQIDRVRKQRTTRMDSLGVAAFLQFDSL